jgi:formate hydrogenlyase subunit 4
MKALAPVLILISALFFEGIIARTKSLLSGRTGPVLTQFLWDIKRLVKKAPVYGRTTSFLFRLAPSIYLASVVTACLLIPFGTTGGLLSFEGDFLFFAYILGLGKFMMIIAALDTGSSFEGMGANREALYSMLAEPAFLILMSTLALLSGDISFAGILTSVDLNHDVAWLIGVLSTLLLVQIALIENSRMPIDDPKTHLELTMVHEVMVLDYSGLDLALIHLTGALKFAMYGALIANFFLQTSWSAPINSALFMATEIGVAVAIGFTESFQARFRLRQNPQFVLTLTAMALLLFFSVLLFTPSYGS